MSALSFRVSESSVEGTTPSILASTLSSCTSTSEFSIADVSSSSISTFFSFLDFFFRRPPLPPPPPPPPPHLRPLLSPLLRNLVSLSHGTVVSPFAFLFLGLISTVNPSVLMMRSAIGFASLTTTASDNAVTPSLQEAADSVNESDGGCSVTDTGATNLGNGDS